MADRPTVEIARIIGSPIDVNFPVPADLAEICNIEPVLPVGERVYTFVPDDSNGVDTIYTSGSEGQIVTVKVGLGNVTEIYLSYIQSKLEYVLVQELAESPDQGALARRKVSISRAMDKIELKRCLDLILALNGATGIPDQSVIRTTGEDIWDLIVAMVRKVENYGTDYVLLAGTTANAEIEDYDKAQVGTFNYKMGISEMLKEKGIKKIKILGNIKLDSGSDLPILAVNKMILVARNSNLLGGKPIAFVRRQIRDLVANAGGTVDAKERALYVAETPTPLYSGTTLTHGYGIFGFESLVEAILNYRAVCWSATS